MKKRLNWPVGICSWSVKNDLELLSQLREQGGIEYIHLDIRPAVNGDKDYLRKFQSAGWKFSAAMVGFEQEDYSTLDTIKRTGGIVPDEQWPQNRDKVFMAIELTRSLGLKYLEFHFGFIDEPGSVGFDKLAQKAEILAEEALKAGLVLLMETGQETASTLRGFLEKLDHPALAVNFDPGNMILYGKGDPVEAVQILGKWIRHIHAKDAVSPVVPGQWGTETRWGQGQVWRSGFLKALEDTGFEGTLCIEREAGAKRIEDIVAAAALIREYTECE